MKHNLKIKGNNTHMFYKKNGNMCYDSIIYKIIGFPFWAP